MADIGIASFSAFFKSRARHFRRVNDAVGPSAAPGRLFSPREPARRTRAVPYAEAKRANMGGRISEECEEQAFQLDFLAQQVRQRAGFGELDIAMRVAPDLFKQLGDDRLAGGVVNAFGNSDDATAQLAGTSIFRKA